MQGKPWTLLAARKARWVPETYQSHEAAPAARN